MASRQELMDKLHAREPQRRLRLGTPNARTNYNFMKQKIALGYIAWSRINYKYCSSCLAELDYKMVENVVSKLYAITHVYKMEALIRDTSNNHCLWICIAKELSIHKSTPACSSCAAMQIKNFAKK